MTAIEGMQILKTKDLQEILGVGRDTAYALMRSPSFPSTKLGRIYIVTDKNLKQWLETYKNREFQL